MGYSFMRFRKGRKDEIKLSIAPLIDIVFLLLIFFMVTSHFDFASGVPIRLPHAAKRALNQGNVKITLVIDKSGRAYLEGKKTDMKTLRRRLQDFVTHKDIVHLILKADKDVRHGKVVEIMDLAKAAGIQTIIIAAKWKHEKTF
jgi:biopolymer transport protein ExbD